MNCSKTQSTHTLLGYLVLFREWEMTASTSKRLKDLCLIRVNSRRAADLNRDAAIRTKDARAWNLNFGKLDQDIWSDA